jgi:hypothetical protein
VSELGLLEPMQAQISLESGERMSLGGFMAVNRSRLKALSGDALADLAKTDELELLYLHLQSMRNFTGLKDRLVVIQGGKTDEGAGSGAPEDKQEDRHGKQKGSGSKSAKRA